MKTAPTMASTRRFTAISSPRAHADFVVAGPAGSLRVTTRQGPWDESLNLKFLRSWQPRRRSHADDRNDSTSRAHPIIPTGSPGSHHDVRVTRADVAGQRLQL